MMRRILVGAALAGLAFAGSATSASATTNPGPSFNDGNSVLSQFSMFDKVPVLNGVLNKALNDIDVLTIAHLERVNLNLLNNSHH